MDDPRELPERRFFHWFPRLERDERKDLAGHFADVAVWNIDFVFMMALSTALAALGLLLDSTAVVIGAMLVAPLMTPLVAAGFAVVQGNVKLFRTAGRAMLFGVLVSFGVAFILGLTAPVYEPTLEVEARTTVNVLDLAVALFSGMAAGYAMGRPNVAGTMAGVAIAAALVPPLSVVGLSLAMGRPDLSGLAAVLFLANVVCIVLGAAIVFRWLGVHGSYGGDPSPLWARRASILLVLGALSLVFPLGMRLATQARHGQARPVMYPLSPPVREAIDRKLAEYPGVYPMVMGRRSVQPEFGIGVFLTSADPVPRRLESELIEVIRAALGSKTVPIYIVPLQRNWDGPAPGPALESNEAMPEGAQERE